MARGKMGYIAKLGATKRTSRYTKRAKKSGGKRLVRTKTYSRK